MLRGRASATDRWGSSDENWRDALWRAVRLTHEAGLRIFADIMVGLSGETMSEAMGVNLTGMPADDFNRWYRRFDKYFVRPLLTRQLLRDTAADDPPLFATSASARAASPSITPSAPRGCRCRDTAHALSSALS